MNQIKKLLLEDVAFYDAPINELKLNLYAAELSKAPLDKLKEAMSFFRNQPGRRQMPMPADLLDRIAQNDGRPGVEQAWAMIPKNEEDSVVWTNEMSEAFGVARPLLLEGDAIAARMAFKEKYQALLAEARMQRKQVNWSISYGTSVSGREVATQIAEQKGLLKGPDAKFLTAPSNANPERVKQIIQETFKKIGEISE